MKDKDQEHHDEGWTEKALKHGDEQWGRHEFYAILKEEVDELWDAIKGDFEQDEVVAELMQVAAMCFRYYETGDRYRETRIPARSPLSNTENGKSGANAGEE